MLKPEDLMIENLYEKNPKKNNSKIDSSKILTSVKTQGRLDLGLIADSTMSCNPNLKKTVKVNK